MLQVLYRLSSSLYLSKTSKGEVMKPLLEKVVELICSFGCGVLLCRGLLLRLSNYRDYVD